MKIAIIDHDASVAAHLREILEDSGHATLAVHVGIGGEDEDGCDRHTRDFGEIIAAVRSFGPDAVLMDHRLNGDALTGQHVARSLQLPPEKVIGTSGLRQGYCRRKFERKYDLNQRAVRELLVATIQESASVTA
jgi:CheY-like chemotaxis protein